MATKSQKSKFITQLSCYIIGATIGTTIGSKIQYLSDGVPADLRYGASGLGGLIGWLVTPLLLGIAVASGVSMVRPPPPSADQKVQETHQDDVIGCGITLLAIGAIANFGLLAYTLFEQDSKKGLPTLLLVIFFGIALSAFGSARHTSS